MTYQAFMSYSHAADGGLSPAIQSALHRLAKRWYQMRAMRVFRDKTSLSANPALWEAIQNALAASEYFLLLASPQSARSPWVRREIEWWLDNRPADRLVVLLTDGELAWDAAARDFDWSRTTALPEVLRGRFRDEPLYIDLCWAKTAQNLSLRHSQFRAAILDVAATLRGVPKDELDGEDVRQHRRTRRLAAAAVAGILAFAVAAAWQAYVANVRRQEAETARAAERRQRQRAQEAAVEAQAQRDEAARQRDRAVQREREANEQRELAEARRREAERQSRIARSRELSVSAMTQLGSDPELGLLLAVEAGSVMATPEAEETLRQALLQSHLRRVLAVADERVSDAAFSPDGRRVATVSWDGVARVWSLTDGKLLLEMPAGVRIVNDVVWSPDGRFLVTADNLGKVRVWDAASGRRLAVIANAGTPVISGDSRLLLTVSLGRASIWEIATGTRLAEITGHGGVGDAAFSPDGRLVVTTSGDGTARVWEAATGTLRREIRHEGGVVSARFSPSGGMIVTAGGGAARLWAQETGEPLRELPGGALGAGHAEFSPTSDGVVMVFEGDSTRLWDLALQESRFVLPGRLIFSPDGEFLAGPEGVWEAATGRRASVFHGPAQTFALSVAFSPDGKTLVSTYEDGTARIWAAGTNAGAVELEMTPVAPGHPLFGQVLAVTAVTFNRQGTRVGAGWAEGRAGVWDAASGRQLWEASAHAAELTAIAFSPDGRRMVTSGKDDLARLWDAASGRPLADLRGHSSLITGAAFSPDGSQVLTQSYDGTARLWAAANGELRHVLGGHQEGVYCAAFDPSGRTIVTCGKGRARLWNAASGAGTGELRAGEGAVTDAAFSPTGRFVVTVGGGPTGDGKARIWEVAPRRVTASFSDVVAAAFGAEDQRLVTRGERTVRVLDWRSGLTMVELPAAETVLWSPDGRFVLTAQEEEIQLWNAATGRGVTSLRHVPILAGNVAFSSDGRQIAVGGLDAVRLYACDACLPFQQLLALARRRLTRRLTAAERETYLHHRAGRLVASSERLPAGLGR